MSQNLDPPRQTWETVDYTDNPELPDIEHVKIVDKKFLPRPEELVFKESASEKVTLSLDKETVAFFKHKAKESGASYQRLVRNILREYVARQNQ
jgi:predicted DNA binding CopG/RHH family protein